MTVQFAAIVNEKKRKIIELEKQIAELKGIAPRQDEEEEEEEEEEEDEDEDEEENAEPESKVRWAQLAGNQYPAPLLNRFDHANLH